MSTSGIPELLSKLSKAKIGVPYAVLMLFLWINGEAWWGPYWEMQTAEAYILMMILALLAAAKMKEAQFMDFKVLPATLALWTAFLMSFAALLIVDRVLFEGQLKGPMLAGAALYPTFFLHAFFVAPVEETIFRGMLKEYTKGWRLYFVPLSPVVTSACFAIFHVNVYGGQVMSLWWAFIMGIIFFYVTELRIWRNKGKLGVPGSIGAHLCYNLFVLGAMTVG